MVSEVGAGAGEAGSFTLAAVQAAPVFLDRDACTEKACRLIAEAGKRGADLAVFGESWLPGYPAFASQAAGPRFGGAVRRMVTSAVEIPSPTTDALCDAARRASLDVVIGIAERDATTRGSIYCTLLVIGREGRILGRHRKVKPTGFERIVWADGDATGLVVHERPYGRLGGLNCWEHQMGLPGIALVAQGIQVHAAVWPSASPRQEILSRAFAMQSAAYVVMVSGVLRSEDVPADLRDLVPALPGRSLIIGPGGDIVAGPLGTEEGILVATGTLGEVMTQRMAADHGGHYARPDLFELRVNRTPRPAVHFADREVAAPGREDDAP